jgi:hypothetical protein
MHNCDSGQVTQMKIATTLLLMAAAAIAGCASKSADIAPAYISPVGYQNFSCEQLQQEAQIVSQRAAVASGQQDRARRGDAVKTTVGVVLFWPVLLFNEGDGAKANEVANLKGQMNAIQQASVQKNCGFDFQQ